MLYERKVSLENALVNTAIQASLLQASWIYVHLDLLRIEYIIGPNVFNPRTLLGFLVCLFVLNKESFLTDASWNWFGEMLIYIFLFLDFHVGNSEELAVAAIHNHIHLKEKETWSLKK